MRFPADMPAHRLRGRSCLGRCATLRLPATVRNHQAVPGDGFCGFECLRESAAAAEVLGRSLALTFRPGADPREPSTQVAPCQQQRSCFMGAARWGGHSRPVPSPDPHPFYPQPPELRAHFQVRRIGSRFRAMARLAAMSSSSASKLRPETASRCMRFFKSLSASLMPLRWWCRPPTAETRTGSTGCSINNTRCRAPTAVRRTRRTGGPWAEQRQSTASSRGTGADSRTTASA